MIKTKVSNKPHSRIGQLTVTDKGPVYNVADDDGFKFITPNGEFPTSERYVWGDSCMFDNIKHFPHRGGVVFRSGNAVHSLDGKLFDYEPGITKVIASDPDVVLMHKVETNSKDDVPRESVSVNGTEGPKFHYLWDAFAGRNGVVYDATLVEGEISKSRVYLNHQPISPEGIKVARPFIHKGVIGWLDAPEGTWRGDCQVNWNDQKIGPAQGLRDQRVYSIGEDLVFQGQAGKLFGTLNKNPKGMHDLMNFSTSSDFLRHAFVNNDHVGAAGTIRILDVNGKPAFTLQHTDGGKGYCEVLFNGKSNSHDSYSVKTLNLDGKIGVYHNIPNHPDPNKLFIDGTEILRFPHEENWGCYPIAVGDKFGAFVRSSRYGKMETMLNDKIVGEPVHAGCYFPKHESWGDQVAFDGKPAARFLSKHSGQYLSVQGQTHGPFKAVSLPHVKGNSLYFTVSEDDGTHLMEFKKNEK